MPWDEESDQALRPILDAYTASLSDDRRRLGESCSFVDAARKLSVWAASAREPGSS